MICWICRKNEANSREHKFKASILKKAYGKKFENVFSTDNQRVPNNKYNDKILKFEKNICNVCNESLTRDSDDAFDLFYEYFNNSYSKIVEEKFFDYKSIFGENWSEQKINFYRFIAKHAGCKIIDSNYNRIEDLADFVYKKEYCNNFFVAFQIKPFIKYYSDYYNNQNRGKKYVHLFNSETYYYKTNNEFISFAGWTTIKNLSIIWIYSNEIVPEKCMNFGLNKEEILTKTSIEYENFYSIMNDRVESLLHFLEFGKKEVLNSDMIDFFKNLIK